MPSVGVFVPIVGGPHDGLAFIVDSRDPPLFAYRTAAPPFGAFGDGIDTERPQLFPIQHRYRLRSKRYVHETEVRWGEKKKRKV